jgi:hypothetical protein
MLNKQRNSDTEGSDLLKNWRWFGNQVSVLIGEQRVWEEKMVGVF